MKNKSKSITVRLSEEDYKYLKVVAKLTGSDVSTYTRMMLNLSITAVKTKLKTGEIKDADFQALLND